MANSTVPVTTIARLLNIDERRVQQLVKEGILPKEDRGQYQLLPCVQGYIRYLQGKLRNGNGGSDALTQIKTRKEEAKTRMAEMAVQQLEGELIPAMQIGKAWTEMVAHLRAKLLALPNKLAPQLLTAEDLHEIQALLKKQISEALQELSDTEIIVSDATVQTHADRAPNDPEAGL